MISSLKDLHSMGLETFLSILQISAVQPPITGTVFKVLPGWKNSESYPGRLPETLKVAGCFSLTNKSAVVDSE